MGLFSILPKANHKREFFGEGISGRIERCRKGKSLYVIKTYHDREEYETRKEYKTRVLHEFRLLMQLDHPNIIKVYKAKVALDGLCVKMYMEAGSQNVLEILRSQKKRLNLLEVLQLWYQVCSGVAYIHKQGLCHRDLKLENLVMDQDHVTVKLIDFVTAIKCDKPAVGIVGSMRYMAPEMASRISYDGKKADIWSLGIILYYLINNQYPWRQAIHSDPKYQSYLADNGFSSKSEYFDLVDGSSEAKEIKGSSRYQYVLIMLKCVLTIDPQARYDIVRVLADKSMMIED